MKIQRLLQKSLSGLLITAMVLGVVGCSGSQKDTKTDNETNPTKQGADNSEDVSSKDGDGFYVSEDVGGKTDDPFTIMVGWTGQSPDETMVSKLFGEQLGMNYTVEFMQDNDYMATIHMKLGSNADLADIIVLPYNISAKGALVEAGRVMNLNDIYSGDKLKNIPNIDENLKKYIADDQGDMWYIPGWYAIEYDNPWPGWTLDAFWVRTDLLDQIGMKKENIKTITDLEEVMRQFAELKNENGNPIIPMSFVQGSQERIITAAFGVDTAGGVNGMPAVMRMGDEFVFSYDNPQYKEAYRWMNKMYREGLIDIEISTQSGERFVEKLESSQVGIFTTDFWVSKFNETYRKYTDKSESTTLWFEPIMSPEVDGVTKGATSYVNPNPGYMVFINKDTKKLNAALNFLDYVHEPDPQRGHEISEGPMGEFWDITDGQENGIWNYIDEDYRSKREAGDLAQRALSTHELWQITPYSSEWYPWWKKDNSDDKSFSYMTGEWCDYVGKELGNHRVIQDYDNVVINAEGIIALNLENINAVVKEYTAKMVMAETDEKFESSYTEFQKQLDLRGKWSQVKEEWHKLYEEQNAD